MQLGKEIYPAPNYKILKTLNSLCIYKGLQLNLGFRSEEFNISSMYKIGVQKALLYLDKICENCTGDHKLWVIAGGFVAYAVGATKTFNDIDIFICCNGHFGTISKPIIKLDQEETWYSQFNIATYKYLNLRIQFIQVNFKLSLHQGNNYIDLLAMYVMSKFDLPICKVAMHFPLEDDSEVYIIDYSAVDTVGKSTEIRKLKYQERVIPNVMKRVPSLKMLAIMAIFRLN